VVVWGGGKSGGEWVSLWRFIGHIQDCRAREKERELVCGRKKNDPCVSESSWGGLHTGGDHPVREWGGERGMG